MIIEAKEPYAPKDLIFPLFTRELMDEKKYNQLCQLILATKATDPS